MTTNELAARVAALSRDLTAAMEVFPRMNPKQQTSLAIAGDVTIERLYEAWLKFTSQQWRERPAPPAVGDSVNDPNWG